MTENMPPPDGRIFVLRINLRTHAIEWVPSQGEVQSWRMPRGLTANQLAEQIVGVLEHNGLKGEYAQQKFESDEPCEYNPAHALTFFLPWSMWNRLFENTVPRFPASQKSMGVISYPREVPEKRDSSTSDRLSEDRGLGCNGKPVDVHPYTQQGRQDIGNIGDSHKGFVVFEF